MFRAANPETEFRQSPGAFCKQRLPCVLVRLEEGEEDCQPKNDGAKCYGDPHARKTTAERENSKRRPACGVLRAWP